MSTFEPKKKDANQPLIAGKAKTQKSYSTMPQSRIERHASAKKAAQTTKKARTRAPLETERKVFANDREKNIQRCKEIRGCLKNRIRTTKYTFYNFIFINLFEQFSRLANFYFLVLLILQLIPAISSLSPVTTAIPLGFVLAVTALKDGFDDYKRFQSDKTVNNRECEVLRDNKWTKIIWADVEVGDIVKLEADSHVPADLVLLSSDEEGGECFIETADLDGETNLKVRRALLCTKDLTETEQLLKLNVSVTGEPPNNKLHKYMGTLTLDGEEHSLNNDAVILRGCVIRNTHIANGLVIFAGPDSKLMQNSGRARFKRTHIDKTLNSLVLSIFIILIVLCIIAAALNASWEENFGNDFAIYLYREEYTNPTVIGTLQFWSYVIVLNTLVPISLYVSVEIIRLGQSLLIDWDIEMYDKASNTPAVARTTTLNEELGQIDYVFSDKTGTLTQNVMNFLKASIGGEIYGKDASESEEYEGFIDDKMQAALDAKDDYLSHFFRLLALCHTVQPEEIEGKIIYQAQSPDEKALCDAAREAGYVFKDRSSEIVKIEVNGEEEVYELLHILEFNSTRKRMSVILRKPDGKLMIYSKGADTIMYDLLTKDSAENDWPIVEDHLHVFAKDGLRTLVLAQREITEEWYKEWSTRYHDAEVALEDRDEKVENVARDAESELTLVGASAIEDKLQTGVPAAIANIKRAGIKVWVLTGDKTETAINIGQAARLLNAQMDPLLIVSGQDSDEVADQLKTHLETVQKNPKGKPYGLVIDGPSLVYPLPPSDKEIKTAVIVNKRGETEAKWTPERLAKQEKLEDMFVEVAKHCVAVVCCRVSPLQKSQVVTLIKNRQNAITLSIGDGANDVSMIKAAHVGVGISGLEGRQAVLASDFSIAQFRFLEMLLLVHGRWSYLRMTRFLQYFFYKNFAFTLCHFWFAFYNAYSAQTLFDDVFISLFNVTFTSLPILIVGILEQDVNRRQSLEHPMLYEAGPRNAFFTKKTFYWSLIRGGFHSIVLFFTAYLTFYIGGENASNGQDQGGLHMFGAMISLALTVMVNIQLSLEAQHWTWLNFFAIAFGPVTWFVVFGAVYLWDDYFFLTFVSTYFGVFQRMLGNATFWLYFFLSNVIGILPIALLFLGLKQWYPRPNDIVREKMVERVRQRKAGNIEPEASMENYDNQPVYRSSFAFSQTEPATILNTKRAKV